MLCHFKDEDEILHNITVKKEMSVLLLKSKIERIMYQFYSNKNHKHPNNENIQQDSDNNSPTNSVDEGKTTTQESNSPVNEHPTDDINSPEKEELFLATFKYRKDLINVKFKMYTLLNNETLMSFNIQPGDTFLVNTSPTINVYFKLPVNSTKYFIRFFKPKILLYRSTTTNNKNAHLIRPHPSQPLLYHHSLPITDSSQIVLNPVASNHIDESSEPINSDQLYSHELNHSDQNSLINEPNLIANSQTNSNQIDHIHNESIPSVNFQLNNSNSNENSQIVQNHIYDSTNISFRCKFRHVKKVGWILGPVLVQTNSFCQYTIFYTIHNLFNIKYDCFKLFTKDWIEITMNNISITRPENNSLFGLYVRDESINPKHNVNANPCAWSSRNASASKLRSQNALNKMHPTKSTSSSDDNDNEDDDQLELTKAASMPAFVGMKKKMGKVYCSVPVYFSFSNKRILACLDSDEIMNTQLTKIMQELEVLAPSQLIIYDSDEKIDMRLSPPQAKILEFSDLHISTGGRCILL